MQVLLAVAADEAAALGGLPTAAAESLLTRLRLGGGEGGAVRVDVVHVIPPQTYSEYDVSAFASAATLEREREADRRFARDVTEGVALRLSTGDARRQARPLVLEGPVIPNVLRHARETCADLVVAGDTRHGAVGALLAGSVVRALVNDAPMSVLVARPYAGNPAATPSHPDAPVRAVFATDHSEYANRCADRLIAFAPRGLAHVTVVTAYPADRLRALGKRGAPGVSVDLADATRASLEEKSAALVARLRDGLRRPGGSEDDVTFDARVIAGPVTDVLAAAMRAAEADLLIVGARGHGLLERLTPGSVSYREAVAAPWPVLVLRA